MKARYLVAAAVAALTVASASNAAIFVSIVVDGAQLNGATFATTNVDGGTGLFNNTYMNADGSVMVTVNGSGKGTSPLSAPDPQFLTNAVQIQATGTHTVAIQLSQTGLTSTTTNFLSTATINVGAQTLATPASVATYVGATNTAFADGVGGILIGAPLTCTTSTCDSGTMTGVAVHTPTYSETINYNFSLTGNSRIAASATLAAAPEPATWGMMVIGFGAIGAALRTSRRKVVFA